MSPPTMLRPTAAAAEPREAAPAANTNVHRHHRGDRHGARRGAKGRRDATRGGGRSHARAQRPRRQRRRERRVPHRRRLRPRRSRVRNGAGDAGPNVARRAAPGRGREPRAAAAVRRLARRPPRPRARGRDRHGGGGEPCRIVGTGEDRPPRPGTGAAAGPPRRGGRGRGLMCVPMLGERLDELKLGMMVAENTAPMGTAFTISVDARRGITTGISAHDRAVTIRALVDPQMSAGDLVTPGHMFPLRAMEGGVLRRAGHTEAAVDLARMAGCYPAGVICEVLDESGGMARLPQLTELARRHALKLITIKDLIEYRTQKEKLVKRLATTRLPTDYGEFTAIAYEATVYSRVHFAIVMGQVSGDDPVLVRMHSECLTGDVFHSLRCDCGPQ